jgi:hypothetical protein
MIRGIKMQRQSLNTLAGILAGIVVGMGIQVALAWNAPTVAPPDPNGVSGPITTGGAGQFKTGSLGIGTSYAPVQSLEVGGNAVFNGILFGAGADTTYGALTVRGTKNGWSGLNFRQASGANTGTLMMHPSYSGFFNAADNDWRWYVTDIGESWQKGGSTLYGALRTYAGNDWSVVSLAGGGVANASPQSYIGSAYVNDVYLRSVGKWASQMGGAPAFTSCQTIGGAAQGTWYSDGAAPQCPAGWTMNGIQTWGGCSGGVCGSNIICCH